jgi:hypothetical protein
MWRWPIAITTAGVVGVLGWLLGLELWLVIAAVALVWLGFLFREVRNQPRSGEWQRQIDREFELRISDGTVTLLRHKNAVSTFVWNDVREVQSLSHSQFPPLWWRIIGSGGVFDVPCGGRYAEEFERRFIYALPDYRAQQVVQIPAPQGFRHAKSMWRKDDPYPKVVRDYDWWD